MGAGSLFDFYSGAARRQLPGPATGLVSDHIGHRRHGAVDGADLEFSSHVSATTFLLFKSADAALRVYFYRPEGTQVRRALCPAGRRNGNCRLGSLDDLCRRPRRRGYEHHPRLRALHDRQCHPAGRRVRQNITIAVVTLVLAAVVVRARQTLFAAASEGTAKRDLSRFFDANVARQITGGDSQVVAGEGEYRNAAVLVLDIRGFTAMSNSQSAASLIRLLSDYQAHVVPVIQGHGGGIDKFLGDGILATFGAAVPSETYAADALRAVDEVLDVMAVWNEERTAAGLPSVPVNAAVATGELIFGAVGDDRRLEYTLSVSRLTSPPTRKTR